MFQAEHGLKFILVRNRKDFRGMIDGIDVFHNHNRNKIIREIDTMSGKYTVIPEPENIFTTDDQGEALRAVYHLARITGKMHTICVGLNLLASSSGVGSIESENGKETGIDDFIIKTVSMFKSLKKSSIIDTVTGIYNRTFLDDTIKSEFSRASRYGTYLSCVMVDIDNFKAINDISGHVFGDTILHGVAQLLKSRLRRSDIVCRFGGDEFCILMPHTGMKEVCSIMERITGEIAEEIQKKHGICVGFSYGVSSMCDHDEIVKSSVALLEQADKALYEAKQIVHSSDASYQRIMTFLRRTEKFGL